MTSGRDRPPLGAIAPTTIRIPPDLRDALQREANINGKTLSSEIVERLRLSLEVPPVSLAVSLNRGASVLPQGKDAEIRRAQQVTDAQRMLLSLFDAMPPDKQLALLTVLRR